MFHEDGESIQCGGGNCAERLNDFPKVKAESVTKLRIKSQSWVPRGSPILNRKQGGYCSSALCFHV